ncbi:putative F-box protein [Raphanus sativus]|nr:putative F-box protein [Raphanus sativus]
MVKYLLRGRDTFVAPEISFDLMIEILSRLPVKSLMRFKCVSKLWSCLIRSRYFTNVYLMVSSSLSRPRPLGLYMSLNMGLSLQRHYACDSMELCQNHGKSELLSLRLLPSSSSAESSLEPDLTFPGMGGYRMVSLRGLILYTVCRKACIYNPATRQSLTLPAAKSNIFAQQATNKHVYYFFGHDPVLDQYKIVCNVTIASLFFRRITSEYWVFVLEPGGFWKKLDYDDQPHLPTRPGLCISGVIYYPASSSTCGRTVNCFDVRSEVFRVIPVSQFCKYFGFIEHGGKPATLIIHVLEKRASQSCGSWRWMVEYGRGSLWF